MAKQTFDYLIYEYSQEEQRDDTGALTQPHFLLQTKLLLTVDEDKNTNSTNVNAQLHYSAVCNSAEWLASHSVYGWFNNRPNLSSGYYPYIWLYDDELEDTWFSIWDKILEDYYYEYEKYWQLKTAGQAVTFTTPFFWGADLTFQHHLNGERAIRVKTCSTFRAVGIEGALGSYNQDKYKEHDITLLVDRCEYPVMANSFTDEGIPSITYTSPTTAYSLISYNGNYETREDTVTSMQLALSFDGVNADITYRTLPLYGIDYSLQLTEEERELLRTKAQGSTTVPIYYLLKTVRNVKYGTVYNETKELVSATERSLTIMGCEPVILPVVRDIDATTVNLTGNSDIFVKNHSIAEFSVNASASKGATIVSQSVRCGSVVVNRASGTIDNVQSGTFIFSATDSRGQTVEAVLDKQFIEYIPLTCNQKASIQLAGETGAEINVEITGLHYNGSFGAVWNDLILEIRHTQNDGNMGEWVTLTDFMDVAHDGNSYLLDFTISELRYDISYTIQCRAIDKLGFVTTAEYTTTINPIFDWSDTDFNFNVPVVIKGSLTVEGEIIGSGSEEEVITPADYVVEEGTSSMGSNGTWYWRKWLSGKAECYGCRNYGNMGVSTTWGVLFRSEAFSQSLPYGLFAQTPEVIDITFRASNFGAWIAKHEASAPSADSSGGFIVVRPASATLSQAYISFNVIGRWK